jgi:hypothetical protein
MALACFFQPVWAVTFYVNGTNGDDSNSGVTTNAAFRTIQKAANSVSAGDEVLVQPGNYDERISITQSGTHDEPIVFNASGTVVTHGFNVTADYIHIIGFEVTDTVSGHWRDGIGMYVTGKYNEIRDNYVHDVHHIGIRIFAQSPDSPDTSHNLVTNNRIERAGLAGLEVHGRNSTVEYNDISGTKQNGYSDADGMRFLGSGHIIRGNNIHDILISDPGNSTAHVDCFQTWGPAYNMHFEKNRCDNPNDDMQGFMIQEIGSPVENITIINNMIFAFRPLNVHQAENVIVANNVFKSDLNFSGISGYGIELHSSPYARVENNIFYDVGRSVYPYLTLDSGSQQGTQIGHNSVYMSNGAQPAGNPRTNDLWQIDPKCENPGSNDFRLKSDSPLIDAGNHVPQVTADMDGVSRPQGGGFEIGMYEYVASEPPDTTPPSPPQNLHIVQQTH